MSYNKLITPLSVFFGVFLLLIIFYYAAKPKIVTEDDENGKPKVVAKRAIPLALIISSVLGAITTLIIMYMDSGSGDHANKSERKSERSSNRSSDDMGDNDMMFGMRSHRKGGHHKKHKGMKYYF